ncbi:MAG TPA: hypothetical protein VFZ89_04605 [Solirubrobacteraceae bacterium]
MDAHLKRLAEIGLDLTAAEEALDEGANTNARELLDRVAEALDELRGAWPDLSDAERKVIGPTAAPLRARLDAARARLPRLVALTEVPQAERIVDPEDDGPPEAA